MEQGWVDQASEGAGLATAVHAKSQPLPRPAGINQYRVVPEISLAQV